MSGITVYNQRLHEIEEIIKRNVIPHTLADASNELFDEIVKNTPKVTGHLANHWSQKLISENERLIDNNLYYAEYVIDGTRPHEIKPRTAGALSFVVNGHTIFAKRVEHPGNQPNPFVEDSILTIEARLEAIVAKNLQEGGV